MDGVPKKHIHWIMPIIGTCFVGMGLIATFMTIQTYMVDAFTKYAASAIAANTVLRSTVGAFLPLAGPPLYAALGLGLGQLITWIHCSGHGPCDFYVLQIWREDSNASEVPDQFLGRLSLEQLGFEQVMVVASGA